MNKFAQYILILHLFSFIFLHFRQDISSVHIANHKDPRDFIKIPVRRIFYKQNKAIMMNNVSNNKYSTLGRH